MAKKHKRGKRKKKQKNKMLKTQWNPSDDTPNAISKILTRLIHRHHRKSILELMVSHTCHLKIVTCSLVGFSSLATELTFHGFYGFVLLISL
jgi:hypothetical protein